MSRGNTRRNLDLTFFFFWPCFSAVKARSPNHWTTREYLKPGFEIQVLVLLLFLTRCMASLGITLLIC